MAKVGVTMPDGLKIKKAKLRGVKSHGMICSERELGFSDDHEGIWVLDSALVPGTKLVDALNLERVVFDFDITPNRADCLSILGFARETALAFDLPLSLPALDLKEAGGNAAEEVRIVIDDPELCPLYNARVLRGVKTRKGPDWMRFRLLALGQRPISNIVDCTNYIMFELGQPLHAFDLDRIEGATIRVAPASDGMKFTTLDSHERILTAADLLIWDGAKPVALAGVMGGLNSEMGADSANVLLEAAIFRPGTIRKTARRLALPSDASYRFERGVDQVMNRFCLDRAAQLMAETSGGSVVAGVASAEPRPWRDASTPTATSGACACWVSIWSRISPKRFLCSKDAAWTTATRPTGPCPRPRTGSTWSARWTCTRRWAASTGWTASPPCCPAWPSLWTARSPPRPSTGS